MMNLADIIREKRKAKGLSIRALASLVGVHHSHLARIERNEARPGYELAAKLAEVLNTPAIFFAAGYMPPKEVIEKIRFELLAAQQAQDYDERQPSAVYPGEDPMQAYSRLAPEPYGEVYTTPEEYISIWEFNRFPVEWLSYIPLLRDELIKAQTNWREQQARVIGLATSQQENQLLLAGEQVGYFAGYRQGLEKAVELLRRIYQQDQQNGLFWVLAAVLVPPKSARILSDLYHKLEAVNFDEYAVKVIFELLHAWESRYRQSQESPKGQAADTEKSGE